MQYSINNYNLKAGEIKQLKQEQAIERQEAYNKLTVKEKLDALDRQFGINKGSTKQRLKLSMKEN